MYSSTKEQQRSRIRIQQEYGPSGVLYDRGSVYEGFCKLTDVRKARGKLYRLETVLTIIVTLEGRRALAKLCGQDTPYAIADWAKNHQEPLVELLQLKRPKISNPTPCALPGSHDSAHLGVRDLPR